MADHTDQIGRLRALAQRAHPGNGAQVHVEELARAAHAIESLERERDALALIMHSAAGNLINSADPRKIAEHLLAPDAIKNAIQEMDEDDQEAEELELAAAALEESLAKVYGHRSVAIAELCDEHLDRSGALLGRVRALALQYSREQAGGENG